MKYNDLSVPLNANYPDDPKIKVQKIVILGGGFAGVRTALELAKQPSSAEVILVNKTDRHVFQPDLYEIATTKLKEPQKKLVFQHLRGSAAIPLKEIFKGKNNVEILIDEVVTVDLKNQNVGLPGGKSINYDVLVLALGSETNYFEIPDLENFSLPLKNADDALNIRNEIDEIFVRKGPTEAIDIVIGGGGFTGCELAGELAGFLKNLRAIHDKKQNEINLSIIEACPTLMNGAPKPIQQIAEKRLRRLGISLNLNKKITKVTREAVFADPNLKIQYDLLIWTAGIKANSLVSTLTGVRVEKSCLVVDKTLRVIPHRNVFAVGDIAYCFDEKNSSPVPATAQTAVHQAKHTAENITRLLKGDSLILYKPKMPKFIVPLGGKFAAAKISGLILEGIDAWWLKRAAALRYFSSVLPLTKALEIWREGNKFFIQND